MRSYEWHGKAVLEATNKAVVRVASEIAKDVERDAKIILKSKAKQTTAGGLLDQFDVQELDDGTSLVWCQGPRNWKAPYHASFFELGTYKDDPHPFLRPAKERHERKAKNKFEKALEQLFRGAA